MALRSLDKALLHADSQIQSLRHCRQLADGDKSIIKLIEHLTDLQQRALFKISELKRQTRPESAGEAFRSALSLKSGGMRRSVQSPKMRKSVQ